jgi:hypothetical protein
MFVLAGLLTFHERITFERTQKLGAKYGLVTRPWTAKLARKYLRIYFTWFVLIQTIFILGTAATKFVAGVLF